MKKTLHWETRSGVTIDLYQYDNVEHIQNILNLLEREYKKLPYKQLVYGGGDTDGWASHDMIMERGYKKARAYEEYIKEIKNILRHKKFY